MRDRSHLALLAFVLVVMALILVLAAWLWPLDGFPSPLPKPAAFTEGWPGLRAADFQLLVWRYAPVYVELDGWV
jgi:hypothetical protein